MICTLLKLLGLALPLTYLLLDGHFGNNNALQMARQINLHLISKLRYDSALYLPYKNPEPERRCRRKYGDKLNCRNLPIQLLKTSSTEEDIRTDIYQAQLLHQEFAQPLNVVILVKTNLKTQVRNHVILFSSRRIQKLRPALITTRVYMGFTDPPKGLALILGDL